MGRKKLNKTTKTIKISISLLDELANINPNATFISKIESGLRLYIEQHSEQNQNKERLLSLLEQSEDQNKKILKELNEIKNKMK